MAKTPTIKELQLQISKLNQSNRALKRHADERLSKLNAIKQEMKDFYATHNSMSQGYNGLLAENKSLKSDKKQLNKICKKLQDQFDKSRAQILEIQTDFDSLERKHKKYIADSQNDFTKLREENEALRKANITNEEGKADKIFEIARTLGISTHTVSFNDILEKIKEHAKATGDLIESNRNYKAELRKLLYLPETASMADILNAIVKLKIDADKIPPLEDYESGSIISAINRVLETLKANGFVGEPLEMKPVTNTDFSWAVRNTLHGVEFLSKKYQTALSNGKEAIKALGLPAHAKEKDILEAIANLKKYQQHDFLRNAIIDLLNLPKDYSSTLILEAIDFLKHKYEPAAQNLFKQVCKLFDKNIFTTSVDDLMALISKGGITEIDKTRKKVIAELLTELNLEYVSSIDNTILNAVKSLKLALKTSRQYEMLWEKTMHNAIGCDSPIGVSEAIKNLREDLAAARDQEDKNAREVDRLKKLNLELQAELNEFKKPLFEMRLTDHLTKAINDIIKESDATIGIDLKNKYNGVFKRVGDDGQTKLEQELREKNDELIKKCNNLNFENTQLKNTIESYSKKQPQSTMGRTNILEIITMAAGYNSNIKAFAMVDSLLMDRAIASRHYLKEHNLDIINIFNAYNNQIRNVLGIIDIEK